MRVTLRVTGEASPVVENVWWDALSTLATAFSVSRNGILAYQTGGLASTRLLWLDRSGHELGAVGPPGAYIEPALSPDGKWLALTRAEPESGRVGVSMIDIERGNVAPVSPADLFGAAAPSGAPTDAESPTRRIHREACTSGTNTAKAARSSSSRRHLSGRWTTVSRDGRSVFYDSIDFRTFHVVLNVFDLESNQSRHVSEATWDETVARASPDGRWLAYSSDESGTFEIMVAQLSGLRLPATGVLGRRNPAGLEGRRQGAFLCFAGRQDHGCRRAHGAFLRGGRSASALSDADSPARRGAQQLRRDSGRSAFPGQFAAPRRCFAPDHCGRAMGAVATARFARSRSRGANLLPPFGRETMNAVLRTAFPTAGGLPSVVGSRRE